MLGWVAFAPPVMGTNMIACEEPPKGKTHSNEAKRTPPRENTKQRRQKTTLTTTKPSQSRPEQRQGLNPKPPMPDVMGGYETELKPNRTLLHAPQLEKRESTEKVIIQTSKTSFLNKSGVPLLLEKRCRKLIKQPS